MVKQQVSKRIGIACSFSRFGIVQSQFVILLLLVSSVTVLLTLFQPTVTPQSPPVPVHPRVYVTSECGQGRRLGNVMFTYASLLGISRRNNATPVIQRRSILADVFKLTDAVLLSDDMSNTMSGSSVAYREFGGRAGAYDPATRNLTKATGTRCHVYLLGYYQSWRYFDDVTDVLRRNFVFKDEIARRVDKFLQKTSPPHWPNSSNNTVRVGIHVRRGDMALTARNIDYGYTVAPSDYFLKAMNMFVRRYRRVQFVVCSDDIAWCKANIPSAAAFGVNAVDVVFSTAKSEYDDLAILARCRDVIMSVGSYGWWAAWLANGTTVYYADWPRPKSMLAYDVDKVDYFPPHWIPLR